MKPYLVAADLIRKRVSTGFWAPGQRIASQNELANELAISVATVQKALKEVEREGLIRSEHGRGRFVTDPALAQRSWTIGVVLFDLKHIGHPAASQRLMGIKEVIEPAGYNLSLFAMNNNGSPEGVGQWAERIGKGHLDGLIVVAQEPDMQTIRKLASRAPSVWMDGPVAGDRLANVSLDYLGGGFAAAQHLMLQGHRRIFFAAPSAAVYRSVQQQRAGIKLAVDQLGGGRVALETLAVDGFSSEHAEWAIDQLMAAADLRQAGLICASDEIARGVLKACAARRLRIPNDLSIIAWNDTIRPEESPVPLTTVRMDFHQAGVKSARLLLQLIDRQTPAMIEEHLPAELIVRGSTAVRSPNPGLARKKRQDVSGTLIMTR
jgi:DNA-binding LacI/PurR family transcriptional regulator